MKIKNKKITGLSSVLLITALAACTASDNYGTSSSVQSSSSAANSSSQQSSSVGTTSSETLSAHSSSSEAITPPYDGPNNVAIYTDCDYSGSGGEVELGSYLSSGLLANGVRNNTLSSVKVPPGFLVTLYNTYNFAGTTRQLTEDQPCLENIEYDNTAGSIVVSYDYNLIDLALGRQHYIDAGCAGCHGIDGQGITPINVANCTETNCLEVEGLAAYIAMAMPPSTPTICPLTTQNPHLSCAVRTAAFIANYFDTGEVAGTVSNIATPLARLSNEEYLAAARTLLSLTDDSTHLEKARLLLPPESDVLGLNNDAYTQSVDQNMLFGFLEVAKAAANDFLEDANSLDDLRLKMHCANLQQANNIVGNYSIDECIEHFSAALLTQAYGRELTVADLQFIDNALSTAASHLTAANITNRESFAAKHFILSAFIRITLVTPDYLFFVENGEMGAVFSQGEITASHLSSLEIAKRLAFFLTGNLPDEALLADAKADLLANENTRLKHINRLLNSDYANAQFVNIINGWLAINQVTAEQDDIDNLIIFLTDWFSNSRAFSDFYNGSIDIKYIDGSRSAMNLGILGSRAFVASHTSYPTPGFINRGEFITTRLLCGALPEDLPDDAFESGSLTNLEVFEIHGVQDCATCHKVFDNYGALFQQFNDENNLFDPNYNLYGNSFDLFPIGDISGTVTSLDELTNTLGSSETAPACMSKLLYRHALRRNISINGGDEDYLNELSSNWLSSGDTSIKNLIRIIALSDHFITLYK